MTIIENDLDGIVADRTYFGDVDILFIKLKLGALAPMPSNFS